MSSIKIQKIFLMKNIAKLIFKKNPHVLNKNFIHFSNKNQSLIRTALVYLI